jgi:hypothetical protein
MNRLFLSIMFAFPVAVTCCAQQPIPAPLENAPHNKIFRNGSLPEAKTPAEYQAYAKAAEVTGADDAEKAADQFAIDYLGSELRYLLYSRVMRMYQEAGNNEGILRNSRKVLTLHPNDPVALVMISTVLTEHASGTDPDREAHFTEAVDKARRAINNIDTALILPPKTPQTQILQAKNSLLCAAHASIGYIELLQGNNADAEKELRASLEAGKADPNPLTWVRLAQAQENQKDYAAALDSTNQALRLGEANTPVQALARQEHDRLLHLTHGDDSSQPSAESKF